MREKSASASETVNCSSSSPKSRSFSKDIVELVLFLDLTGRDVPLGYLEAATADLAGNRVHDNTTGIKSTQSGANALGFFGSAASQESRYTKFIIVDDVNLKHRSYAAARGRQAILLNRDIIRLFQGLRVSDSFLLQNNMREILFRKTP